MENLISIEEAKRMVGTEFTYVYEDGDEILAYVKAFDPVDKGLTCYTLDIVTKMGWKEPEFSNDLSPDGTWCVIGGSIDDFGLEGILKDLTEIRDTGRLVNRYGCGYFAGCAF